MALSIGKKSTRADAVEDRLRSRLAELESRLDDGSRLRQLEEHIGFLKRKHELELEAAKLEADKRVMSKDDEVAAVKGKAAEAIGQWKKLVAAHESRYNALVGDLVRLDGQITAVAAARDTLSGRGLKPHLVGEAPGRDPAEDARAYVDRLIARERDVADRLDAVAHALGNGTMARPTTDVEILVERAKELLSNPELKSKALTVAEKARMFASDPGKSQYYRELVVPYANAIRSVLETSNRGSIVHGAQEALSVVENAFRDSRTFLLRRSGDLDEHSITAPVGMERLEEAPADALGRMQAVLDNARALGPVDFFHNMTTEIASRVERGDQGARVAAWILSDVTVAVLEDEKVRTWLARQR